MTQDINKLNKSLEDALYNGAKNAFNAMYDIEVGDNPKPDELRRKMAEKFANEFAKISVDIGKSVTDYLDNVKIQHQLTYTGGNLIGGLIKINTKL